MPSRDPDYVLYCFAESGNAYKPALMLALCGQDWQARFVDFFNGETRSDHYRDDLNAMGEAPVLVHKGRKLTQSGAILHYLSEQTGRFGPRDDDERFEIMRWILYDNHKFTSYVATLRFLLKFAGTGETPVTEFLRARAEAALGLVDKQLADRDFLIANRLTIADISLCGYLYYEGELGIDMAPYENIAAWLARIAGQPGWQSPYDLMPSGSKS